MKAKDLRDKSSQELGVLKGEFQKDLIQVRLNMVTGTVENVRKTREVKRDIARINTILRQRELSAQKSEA